MTSPLHPWGEIDAKTVDTAAAHLRDVLDTVVEHGPAHKALVVYDTRSDLARALTEGYRRNLPDGVFIDFDTVSADEVLVAFKAMQSSDLVVLVQSTNFRLEAFRIRHERLAWHCERARMDANDDLPEQGLADSKWSLCSRRTSPDRDASRHRVDRRRHVHDIPAA